MREQDVRQASFLKYRVALVPEMFIFCMTRAGTSTSPLWYVVRDRLECQRERFAAFTTK